MKNKKIKINYIYLTIAITLLVANTVFLLTFYHFNITSRLANDVDLTRKINQQALDEITENLYYDDFNVSLNIIKKYVKTHNSYICIKDAEGNIIYENRKQQNKGVLTTKIVRINNFEYVITYTSNNNTPGSKIIRDFILNEIIIVSIFIVIIFILGSKYYVGPFDTLMEDINNYKYGKRPYKRKLPGKIGELHTTFVDTVDTLEGEKDYKNQILASISHDIKNPLTSIMGYADRLKNNDLSADKQKEYVDKIYNKSVLIKAMLEDFDDYQSINIRERLNRKKATIKELSNDLKNEFEEDLKDRNIILNMTSDCEDKYIDIDIIRLRRLYGNIINNSIRQFNNKPGVINITTKKGKNKLTCTVSDNAGGIKDERVLKQIFEPLYTTDPTRKISGLGLAICKEIVTAHDGSISAKNNDIGGLSIIITIYNLNNF